MRNQGPCKVIYKQIPAQPFYVYTDEQYVYVCLEQGKNAAGQAVTSTVKPTGTADHIMTADGYTWKFLYSIGALRESKFQASNFIPVKLVNAIDSSSSLDDALDTDVRLFLSGTRFSVFFSTGVTSPSVADASSGLVFFARRGL